MSENATRTNTKKPRTKITLNPLYRSGEYQKSYHEAFERISQFYIEALTRLEQSPIGSSNIDPGSPRRMRWSLLVEYTSDYERIVERACKGDPIFESTALALIREIAGLPIEPISNGLRYKVIQRLGQALSGRMEAKRYFTTIVRKREREENKCLIRHKPTTAARN